MAPKAQGVRKGTITKDISRHVAPTTAAVSATVDYSAVQLDEIEALQAIFMDDFEEIKVESAWSKTSEHRFRLRIASFEDPESYIVLTVRLTATYPKTAPIIEIDGLDKFHERTRRSINAILLNRPKQLLGDVMIHAIVIDIQDALEDAVQARQKDTLPSLNDERENAEEVANALAKQAEDAEDVRRKVLQQKEEQALSQLVQQELTRRDKRKNAQSTDQVEYQQTEGSMETIGFDEYAEIAVGKGHAEFKAVTIVSKDGKTMLGMPQIHGGVSPPLVLVKRYHISIDRQAVIELEANLKQVRQLRHANVAAMYQYRFDKRADEICITICSEMSSQGSLQDLLNVADVLQVDKARQFSIELLEALEECHRHGVAHGSINCATIKVCGSTDSALKLFDVGYGRLLDLPPSVPKKWLPPEASAQNSGAPSKKADVWSLGVVILQMCLGINVMSRFTSPQSLLDKTLLSDSFLDFISQMLHPNSKTRSTPFDLLAAEFLRSDDGAMADRHGEAMWSVKSDDSRLGRRTSRHDSTSRQEIISRYAQDFTEIGRLGKGGFGEVVKARNKLDGGIYAIKKIVRAPRLDQILSEVMLLNRLNHPYVVRYFSTWVEESAQQGGDDTTSSTDGAITEDQDLDFVLPSAGGLDFVSSSGYPLIEFGVDSDSDESADSSREIDSNEREAQQSTSSPSPSERDRLQLRKLRSAARRVQTTLYIQMEFCERRTLRDLIRRKISEEECWRLMRQVAEGLAHVHSHGIIHRDLKPDNIFIGVAGDPKIGDFGLATTAQHNLADRSQTLSGNTSVDMTLSVGTAMYIAPELALSSASAYNEKVDMYSLGIIFFEMCEPFTTAMERMKSLQEIRQKEHILPTPFQTHGLKAAQGKVISCLISHKPSERPSSLELLRTNLLPVKIEDETIRQALSSLADPRSPNHQKMMSALFAHDQAADHQIKAMAWDAKDITTFDEPLKLRVRSITRDALINVFRLHGAEEVHREQIMPRSTQYTTPNVFQLLDASGNLLQLPYDLTLPNARQLARSHQETRCSYTFGTVFRDTFAGGPPSTNEEVDFDIVTRSLDADISVDDAEVLKVLDHVVTDEALHLDAEATCFHINHSAIIDAILNYCQVPLAKYTAVKECISKLGFRHFTWSKIRNELRSHAFGLSITTIEDLEQFDFRDVPERAFSKIRDIFQSSAIVTRPAFDDAVSHIQSVMRHTEALSISRKIWLAPLSCFNAKFYEGGILIQCIHQRKTVRDVLAAGGRYNSLVKACGKAGLAGNAQNVVGISIGLDRLVAHVLKQVKIDHKGLFAKENGHHSTMPKRCEVCIVVGRGEAVTDVGLRLLAALWQGNIAAEIRVEEMSASDYEHDFLIGLRHEGSTTVKVRNLENDSAETDVPIASLVSYLTQELREKQASRRRQPLLGRHPSQNAVQRKGNVQVLMSQHRSRKSNKYSIIETAQQKWAEKLDGWKDAPILAVETRDDVIELIRETRLSDADGWKKALHAVQPNERQYVQQIQELLAAWRTKWLEESDMREACIFNFRTGHGIHYDLGL